MRRAYAFIMPYFLDVEKTLRSTNSRKTGVVNSMKFVVDFLVFFVVYVLIAGVGGAIFGIDPTTGEAILVTLAVIVAGTIAGSVSGLGR